MDYNYSNSYISNLNLESIESPDNGSAVGSNNNLSVFTNNEFFDFDVFANDEFAFKESSKQELQQQFQQQIQQSPEEDQNEQLLNALFAQNNNNNSSSNVSLPNAVPPTPYTPAESFSVSNNNNKPVSLSKVVSTNAKVTKDAHPPVEDKRKRNTLASARFRIKKKLKEQKMEQELNELTLKVNELKSTVLKLEMENKCLKSLVIEKNEKKSNDLLSSIKKNAGV